MTEPAASYGRHPGGRPRADTTATVAGVCPVHGPTEFRIHRSGYDRYGKPRTKARCPECHARRNRP